MKRNYIILLAALLTVACAGNGDIMSPTPQEGEILFSGSTVGPKVRTSYEDTETALRVNWVKNDLIGLFAESGGKNLGANFAYKAAVSGATSDFTAASRLNVIRWADETSDHDFYAYYPYTANPTNDLIEFQVPEAAVQSEQKVNDFLFASGAASYANPSLTLNFTHQMVRVIIKVYTSPEYGFTTNDFAGSLLTFVGYFDSGTFNIKTGKVECSDESVTTYYFGDPQSDHMEYTLYVPAQVMPDMTLQLSNGENFVFLTNDTWKAGHSYSYSLKPVRNTLEVISATISPWTVESEKTINGYE